MKKKGQTNKMTWDIKLVLDYANEVKASDVHFSAGRTPMLRILRELTPLEGDPMTAEELEQSCNALMTEFQRQHLETYKDVDFTLELPSGNRFRLNIYYQKGACTIAARVLCSGIPDFEEHFLPEILKSFAFLPQGLVLVGGVTGSGKSTTIAAMLGQISQQKKSHILTIEDPVEFIFEDAKSLINQRTIGMDTKSYPSALRAALRENPDVIMVGDMRDYETAATVVSAAETGHLVFSTLHASSASKTINRIIDFYPNSQHHLARSQLAAALKVVICQQLIPAADKSRVYPALEILIVNGAVSSMIREGKTMQIDTVIQTNIQQGMCPMDYSLAQMVKCGWITEEAAYDHCRNEELLQGYLSVW